MNSIFPTRVLVVVIAVGKELQFNTQFPRIGQNASIIIIGQQTIITEKQKIKVTGHVAMISLMSIPQQTIQFLTELYTRGILLEFKEIDAMELEHFLNASKYDVAV